MVALTRRRAPPHWSGSRHLPGLQGRIPAGRRGIVVLATVGSLGDLYPILSLARALEAAGLEARLALAPDDCAVARSWGLDATPIGPSRREMCDRLGMTEDEIAAAILRDPGPLLSRVLIPMLPALTAQVRPLCDDATAVAATSFALHAFLAGEMAGRPLVPILLQPMLTFSAIDPPRTGAFRAAVPGPPIGPLAGAARAWNRVVIAAAHATLRLRHRRELNGVRAKLGLPPMTGTPLIDHGGDVARRIGLWDETFAPVAPDAVPDLVATGFPRSPGGEMALAERRWVEDGPPPLVVTLGSIAQNLGGGTFWDEALDLARRLDMRAVFLHGQAPVPDDPRILALRYAPHADLFPRAAAIVHHGGIGTTAEAIRAGRPQLVVPVGGDQPDNASRLQDLGLADALPLRRFTGKRAAARLSALLSRFDYPEAEAYADFLRARDGAAEAALHLASVALAD